MKKIIFSLLYMTAMAVMFMSPVAVTSCSNDNEERIDNPTDEPTDDPAERDEPYTILSEKDTKYYTSVVVEYTSASPDMKGTQRISGVVAIPNGEISAIILDNHHTITSNEEAPSVVGTTPTGAVVGANYCVVATDYIGYGITKQQAHPYLNHEVCARNSIDLAKVAIDLLKKRGRYAEGMKMFNMGYSQGGAVALAVHREMEKSPQQAAELGFTASWCGDGPYDVVATVRESLSHPDKVNYPLGLPMLVQGFMACAPESLKGNLKFADFFTDKMVNAGIEDWVMSHDYANDEVNRKMQAVVGDAQLTLPDIYSPEMCTEDGALMQKYLAFASQNDLCTGWKPEKFPLMIVHMECDDVVTVENAYNAIKGLGLSPSSYYIDTVTKVEHSAFGKLFYSYAMINLIGYL